MFNFKFTAALIALAGCATFEKKSSTPAVEGSSNAIVTQPNRSLPLLPDSTRERWFQQTADAQLPVEQRARANLALGEAKNAQNLLREALAKTPGKPELLKLLGVSYAMQKNFAMAGYYADLVLDSQSGDPVATNLRGLAHLFRATGKVSLEKAAESLRTAHLDSGAQQVAASLNYGELLLQLGRPAEALEVFVVAGSRCGACSQALYGEGVAASRSGQVERALQALENLVARESDHFRGRYQLALVHKNGKKDLKKARSLLESILGDPKLKDDAVRQRANATLRGMNAEDEGRS